MTHTALKWMGTAATLAVLASPALAGGGTHGQVVIDQVQLGQTIADLDVYVPEANGGASAVSTAVGNAGAALFSQGPVAYDAHQTNDGLVAAATALSGGNVYGSATSTTTAYGNSSTAGTAYGATNYRAEQVMNAATSATTTLRLRNVDTVATATTAAANVSVTSATQGDDSAFQVQASNDDVWASTSATLCCDSTSAAFTTNAAGNVGSSTGSTSTNINGAVQTTAAGTSIGAASSVYMADGNDVTSAVTASGNSYVLSNEWGYASLGRQGSELFQGNVAEVNAASFVELDHWSGTAVSSAYGVGNSALVSNVGSDTGLNALQSNYGDVNTVANLTGNSYQGGAGSAIATSIGNAASGVLCNVCGDGTLSGNVNQYNQGNTSATAITYVPNAGPVTGAATAVGNSATFTSNGGG